MSKSDTPFAKHRTYYIVLKWVVIAAAVAIALLAVAFLALRKDDAVSGGRVWSAAHGHYHDR